MHNSDRTRIKAKFAPKEHGNCFTIVAAPAVDRCKTACPQTTGSSQLNRRKSLHEQQRKSSRMSRVGSDAPEEDPQPESRNQVIARCQTAKARVMAFNKTGTLDWGELCQIPRILAGYQDDDLLSEFDEENIELHTRLQADFSADEELQHGAMRGDLRMVQAALLNDGSIVVTNPRGLTPLMLAAASGIEGSIDVVKELLARTADISVCDHHGWDSLHHATRNGRSDVVKLILSAKANMFTKTADGKSLLMLAAMEGSAKNVDAMLNISGLEGTIQDKDHNGFTALHYAVKDNHHGVAVLLCESKAKINTKDKDARPPLMYACEHGQNRCAKFLVKRKADVDNQDMYRRTPMLQACLSGHQALALYLLKKKADAFEKDQYGNSPLRVAHQRGFGDFKRHMALCQWELDQHAQ